MISFKRKWSYASFDKEIFNSLVIEIFFFCILDVYNFEMNIFRKEGLKTFIDALYGDIAFLIVNRVFVNTSKELW